MPTQAASGAGAAAAMRKATGALKAAAVVSAAAVLSRAQGDLEANAKAALGHFDEVVKQLHMLRSGAEARDRAALQAALARFDSRLDHTRAALFEVTSDSERGGLETLVSSIGDLGSALQEVAAITGTADNDAAPLAFDQFFLEAMQELSQRDWSDEQ